MKKICKNCKQEKDLSEFHQNLTGALGKDAWCKICRNKQRQQKRIEAGEETKIAHRDQENKRKCTEKGYIMTLFSSCRKSAEKRGVKFEFDKITWWNHWVSQKLRYGMKCPYSKVTMTHRTGHNVGRKQHVKIPTNISPDQIWPGKGYTPLNLVFCANKFNDNKKNITPDGCEAVLDLYNDRMKEGLLRVKSNFKHGDKFHVASLRKNYIGAFKDGKLRGRVLQLTFYQAKMEQAQETNSYKMNLAYKKRIKNFYK